jgi:hypothetical protein
MLSVGSLDDERTTQVLDDDTSRGALDARARRAAKRMGLRAVRSRWRAHSADNRGAFMLIDPIPNRVMGGARFDMSAEDVIEYCRPR